MKQDFFCHQHKPDTRVFFYAGILDRRSNISGIFLDVVDTGVAVIASHALFRFKKAPLLYRNKKVVLCKTFFLSRKIICYYNVPRYYRS